MTTIASIVAKHALKPGDPMRNIHGEIIADSVVLHNRCFAHRVGNGVEIIHESSITDKETTLFLTDKAFAALRAATF